MRGVGLTLFAGGVLACAAPPPRVASEQSDERSEAAVDEARVAPEPVVAASEADPLLARVRAGVRGGRVPDALRRELVDSTDPDHRHAGRLLQAIAGEVPADVLARTEDRGPAPVELASASESERFDPEPGSIEPIVVPEPEPAPVELVASEPSELHGADEPIELHGSDDPVELDGADEPIGDPPRLSDLVVGGPAWWWFASSPAVEPVAAEAEPADRELGLETFMGPLPLLLRERPPLRDASTRPGDGPRLVILTSLTIRPRADGCSLELAGAGSVRVAAQPLSSGRVRLWMIDAGAVPSFLAARPTASGVEVVDVARRDRRLEIEVELGPGWALVGAASLDNGASVEFVQIPPAGLAGG